MKVVSAREIAVSVERRIEINHRGGKYLYVSWYAENASGYDWYRDGVLIQDPDWADDLDMDELFEKHQEGK